jgi:iron complex transport system substrate-binding protein
MKQRKRLFGAAAAAIALSLVLAACGGQGARETSAGAGGADAGQQQVELLTIKHQLGEAKVKKNPEKVIVFDYGILDTLDKMGVKPLGVPQSNLPPYLSKFKDAQYKNIGSLQEPDFEKISALKPDLIIISGRQSSHYEELSKLGPTVYLAVDTSQYWDSFRENMRTVAAIFDKKDWMEQQLAELTKSVAAVKAQAANGRKALIVLVTGGKASAYGPGSRFGIIHDVLGVAPADANIEASTHGMSISFEYIAAKNPDYLFVIDRDAGIGNQGPSAKQVLENELVKGTNAYKNDRIVYLDPSIWYLSGGGLVSMAEMVDEVAQGLKK